MVSPPFQLQSNNRVGGEIRLVGGEIVWSCNLPGIEAQCCIPRYTRREASRASSQGLYADTQRHTAISQTINKDQVGLCFVSLNLLKIRLVWLRSLKPVNSIYMCTVAEMV